MRDEFGLTLPFDDWIRRKYAYYLSHAARAEAARRARWRFFATCSGMGVVQAVVSNSDRLIVDANLRAVGIVEPGMKTVSRNDVRDGKPDAEPFLRAAWLTGIDPADTVVMEDSFTGARAGLAAGMRTIFWPERPMTGTGRFAGGRHSRGCKEAARAALGVNSGRPAPRRRGSLSTPRGAARPGRDSCRDRLRSFRRSRLTTCAAALPVHSALM